MTDRAFKYADRYTVLRGFVTKDSVIVNYKTEVPLDLVVYWKRKWFLGRKKYFAEAASENKNVKITGLESIQVKNAN